MHIQRLAGNNLNCRRAIQVIAITAMVLVAFAAIATDSPNTAKVLLRVELPRDRFSAGLLWVEDGTGRHIAGPWRVLGKADGETARRMKNESRAPLLSYGDTPTGEYHVRGAFRVGEGTSYNKRSYGDYGALRMDGTTGDAAMAKELGGRTGILIHGGDLGAKTRLRPTNGCLRLSNADMKALLDVLLVEAVVNDAVNAGCTVADVQAKVTDPGCAPDEGYDEGDPPPGNESPPLP